MAYRVNLQENPLGAGEKPINLINGDFVSVGLPGKKNTSDEVTAVNPFQNIELEYVDYFNDIAKGKVESVQVGAKADGRPEFLEYNKF